MITQALRAADQAVAALIGDLPIPNTVLYCHFHPKWHNMRCKSFYTSIYEVGCNQACIAGVVVVQNKGTCGGVVGKSRLMA